MAETMNETQGDVYVRRDVFEARMDRMEMLLEKTVIEIKSYVDKTTGEIKAEISGLRNDFNSEISGLRNDFNSEISGLRTEMKVLTARVDSLEHVFYWGLGGFGIILASAVILPAIMGLIKKLFKPSITIDDVERIVNAMITNHLEALKRGGE